MSSEEVKTFGTHSPFDSDACLEWGVYCIANNHNPDIPVKMTQEEYWRSVKEHINQTK